MHGSRANASAFCSITGLSTRRTDVHAASVCIGLLAPPASLYENREYVIVGLSLDGTPQAHDLNRCGSYARIAPHIPFIANTWSSQLAKKTISPQTVPMIYEGILHIMAQGLLVAANVPMEDIWGSPEQKANCVKIFREQIEKLVHFFGTNTDLPLPNIINLPIPVIATEEQNRPWCGFGRNMVAIETNGKTLLCNRYAAMSFGQSLFDKPLAENKSKCRFFLFRPACQTCEALNWEVNGNPTARTSFHCEFTKLQVWGTAQVLAMRLAKAIAVLKDMDDVERERHKDEATNIYRVLASVALVLVEFKRHDQLEDVGTNHKQPVGLLRWDSLRL